jgi:hypothetical protein
MKQQLSLEQMSQISGGTFSWREFFGGACQAVGVLGILTVNPIAAGIGAACTIAGV